MTLDFSKYAMKGNEFIHCLEDNLGNDDRAHAARVLMSTFRVLRNHLSFEESLQLIAQLPLVIKGLYVNGWRKSDHKRIRSLDEFLIEIVEQEGHSAWRDFNSRDDILECVRAVIDTMRLYVSDEEMNQALRTLPLNLQEAFESPER